MTYKFNQNKYTKWYWQIIDAAKIRHFPIDAYTEQHHVIPKSLGGSNNKSNLVKLTAREHFIVHLLLVRMVDIADTYRMIHAVIRFKQKISTSKEFDLLRSTLHTYSKGQYNTSFGKIWAHDKLTKEIIYIKKDKFCKLSMIKGLPYQRGGFKDYKWINNGIIEAMISKDDTILTDWNAGRISKPSLDHMKQMAANRHTLEKDQLHSEKMKGEKHFNYGKDGFTKGRKWMNRDGKSKMISPELIEYYINIGWKVGRS